MEMCRFTGPNDVEFKKVAFALRRMIGSLSTQVKRGDTLALSDEQKKSLLESLRFDQIDARWMTIKNAHTKTCIWLLKKVEYRDWLDAAKLNEHHGFLWIRGKPGTGKSILMKFLLANARRTMRDRIVISFFFNARGEGLEMSTLGTYQSLLLQLLERLPALQSVFDSLLLSTRDNSAKHQWTVETLKTLLEQAILSLGDSSLVCLIDALDECDEGQIRDMTSFFEHIGELAVSAGIRFQVCFSSRHYPTITIRKEIRLDLEGQEGHTQDIIRYLESELRIGQSNMAEQVRIDVQEKASGIFLWVVLVVGILNKEYDSGRKHSLRRRVHDIPGDLHELFRDILTRDLLHREELVLCVQWVLFARQQLKPEQLYHAILSGVEPHDLSRWDSHEITISDITRYIIDASKGLAEITTSKTPTVQFIHQSVKDFFLKENGFNRIRPDLGDNFQGQSHERLKRCCMSYIQFYISSGDMNILNKDLPKASTWECKALRVSADREFPFLEYAVHHVLYHADSAEGYNVSQQEFIQSFRLPDWLWLDNLYQKHQIRRHTEKATILYILAENDMSNLIKIHPSNLSFLEIEHERYGFPLLASLATSSKSAVGAFLAALAASQPPGSLLQNLCKQYSWDGEAKGMVGRDYGFSSHDTVLSCIAANGDKMLLEIIFTAQNFKGEIEHSNKKNQHLLYLAAAIGFEPLVKQLLEKGSEVNVRDRKGKTPLWLAAENGHEAMVKLLLENKAEINTRDDNGVTPLLCAATNGRKAVVKLLLDNKADINIQDNLEQTPLWLAAQYGHEAIVKMLLANAEVNSKDLDHNTLLSQAASHGHELVVKLLLENNAEIDVKHNYGETPLSKAAETGHEAVVRLLLENGAEVDSRDNFNQTPLFHAASRGHALVVKVLLETGKVDVNSRDLHGNTLLSQAAFQGRELVVKLLLETGKVDLNSKNHTDETPLSRAASSGHHLVVKMLLETGKVDVNSKDHDGRTPLSHAAIHDHVLVVRLLLDTFTVDVNSKDNDGRTPLSHAAIHGHGVVVQRLLHTFTADVNSKDNDGRTPLSEAISNDNALVVKLLLKTGKSDVNSKDHHGRTPLSHAALRSNELAVKELLEAGKVDIDLKDLEGRTPLWWAAWKGDLTIVKLLLEIGKADVNSKQEFHQTPLYIAAFCGHLAIVNMLLETGKADVKSADLIGQTPKDIAMERGHNAVVDLLEDYYGQIRNQR